MAYTVDYFYKKQLEVLDKMGSDFFPLEYIMKRLETATYDFIGETVKFIENTQEISDDINPLYKPYSINVVDDPNDASYKSIALPNDYLHLISAKVIDKDVSVRETRVIRNGQEEIFESNPNTRATAVYPTIVRYDYLLRILSPGTPTSVKGMYVKKPTFGAYGVTDDIETEIAVNLPDNVVEKIIKTIANDIFVATGDPRAQSQYVNKETYRKRSK